MLQFLGTACALLQHHLSGLEVLVVWKELADSEMQRREPRKTCETWEVFKLVLGEHGVSVS